MLGQESVLARRIGWLWKESYITHYNFRFENKHWWAFVPGVSITYKKNIGQWVGVQNRIMETWNSRAARGNPVIHDHTHPHICICDSMPADGRGKSTPKIISFIKACNNHIQRILIHPGLILTNISRIKCNQAMKFGQLIEYNTRNIFLEISYTK